MHVILMHMFNKPNTLSKFGIRTMAYEVLHTAKQSNKNVLPVVQEASFVQGLYNSKEDRRKPLLMQTCSNSITIYSTRERFRFGTINLLLK